MEKFNVKHLQKDLLLEGLKRHLSGERYSQAMFLAHLAEVDERKIYAELGYTSLFVYCTEELKLSEGSTCRRIQAARTSRSYPILFEYLEDGKIHLEAISLISPLLTQENHQNLIKKACHKTKREVEYLIASLTPKPDLPEVIRKLPSKQEEAPASTFAGECCEIEDIQVQPPRPEILKPLSQERYKIQLTGSERFKNKLERAKEILRHQFPEGRLEDILEEALDLLLEKKDPQLKFKQENEKKPSRNFRTRHIPQEIKQEVWQRDDGQCSFISEDGKRCGTKAWLEYDHIKPWALGGASNHTNNIRLLCRAHNQYEAEQIFGEYNLI